MITAASILPLAGAVMCLVLGVLALWTNPHRSLQRTGFVGMNLGIALWGASAFAFDNISGGIGAGIIDAGSVEYWLFVATIVGVNAAAAYWFLFAATTARATRYTIPRRVRTLHGLVILGAVAALTNPWHHLYGHPVDGVLVYGAGWIVVAFILYGLVGWGAVLLLRARGLSVAARRQARMAVAAVLLPGIGAVAWNLRRVLGLQLTVNPAPLLFALFAGCMGYLIFIRGFGGISSTSAQLAFRYAADAIIATDPDLAITSLNESAERAFGDLSAGTNLHLAWSELALLAQECLDGAEKSPTFEIQRGDRTYRGRASAAQNRAIAGPAGCIIALSDVTELRTAERALDRIASGGPR